MPDWVLPSLVGGSLTFVVTLLVVVVRNRRSLLTYHVTHDRIGISTLDNTHGDVSVTVGALLQKSDSIPNALPPDRLGDGQKRLHLPI